MCQHCNQILYAVFDNHVDYLVKVNTYLDNILLDMSNKKVFNVIEYIDKNVFNSPINILQTEFNYVSQEKDKAYFAYVEVEKPIIYIYNSHQGENYSMKYLEEYNITPNVLMASRMLSEKLNNLNINTIVFYPVGLSNSNYFRSSHWKEHSTDLSS